MPSARDFLQLSLTEGRTLETIGKACQDSLVLAAPPPTKQRLAE